MESHDSHVTEEDLARLDAGTLTDVGVAAHVEDCAECNDRLTLLAHAAGWPG